MFVGLLWPSAKELPAMNFGRTISAICASAAAALLAPAAVSAAATVAYVTPAQACTTKDARKPNSALQPKPNPNWWMGTPQSQMGMRLPRGENPNDVQNAMQTFPTVYTQPADKDSGAKITIPVSTCNG